MLHPDDLILLNFKITLATDMIGLILAERESLQITPSDLKGHINTKASQLKYQFTFQSFDKTFNDVFIVMQGAQTEKSLTSAASVVFSYVLSKNEIVFINIKSKSNSVSGNFRLKTLLTTNCWQKQSFLRLVHWVTGDQKIISGTARPIFFE